MAGASEGGSRRRIAFFDELRGLTIISMAAFHACYDLAYLYGLPMPWFTTGPFQDIWRDSISWTFLALAGWMTSLSRNNARRGLVYAAAAAAVFAATTVAAVDTPVSYGILFCMAASTLLYAALAPLFRRVNPLAGLIACLALFAITWGVPRATYPVEHLAWLGFPSPSFASGDYYPVIPFAFMYLAGSFAAASFQGIAKGAYPTWMEADAIPPLSWMGKKSLVIYLAHQPVILLVLQLVLG